MIQAQTQQKYIDEFQGISPAKRLYQGLPIGASVDVKREAEIPHQLECLERTLKGCMQGLETLVERLGGVMRPDEPSSMTDAAVAAPVTQLAMRLQSLAGVAELVNSRIQSITARLEV